MRRQTPSQTIGPFFAYAMTPAAYGRAGIAGNQLANDTTPGQHIRIAGHVFDGAGNGVGDAVVEIWQANAAGRYNHPEDTRAGGAVESDFSGFGRADTQPDGGFQFDTVKPGAIGSDAAPHINVIVMARGMLLHVFTRIYFADENEANTRDRVLATVPAARRDTLIATPVDAAGRVYRFDICLQGDGETVFFDA